MTLFLTPYLLGSGVNLFVGPENLRVSIEIGLPHITLHKMDGGSKILNNKCKEQAFCEVVLQNIPVFLH